MNNSQLAIAFVEMVNGKREKKPMGTANNMYISVQGENTVLMPYYTPIAVYNNTFDYVVRNVSFLSATTAKHQSKLRGCDFNCPVSLVNYFYEWGCAATELLEQADPLYSYKKQLLTDAKGRKYVRFVLLKDKKQNGHRTGQTTEIHRYISEQAAKDEMTRLNRLATPNSCTY